MQGQVGECRIRAEISTAAFINTQRERYIFFQVLQEKPGPYFGPVSALNKTCLAIKKKQRLFLRRKWCGVCGAILLSGCFDSNETGDADNE